MCWPRDIGRGAQTLQGMGVHNMTTTSNSGDLPGTPQRSRATEQDQLVQAFQRLVGEVFRLNGELLSVGERLGKDLGMSPARWQTLATIRREQMTVAEIARRLGLTRQSVQRTANLLRREGLVKTAPNPGHRRSHLVGLTRDGERVWAQLRERQVPLTGVFTDGLGITAQDLDRLAGQLRTIRKAAEGVGH